MFTHYIQNLEIYNAFIISESEFLVYDKDNKDKLAVVARAVKLVMKEFIRIELGPLQDFFKQHLIKNEEQPFFSYSAHFGEVSTLYSFV